VLRPKAGSLLHGKDDYAVIGGLYEVGIFTYQT
jgi:hypothetical protein